jgi:VIT1/CCC1 family predicted Fe2+/Mn2+ transporter
MKEQHKLGSSGWLRAAVLGANDGLLSTSSLILGVAIANPNANNILLTGVAALIAGSMSMASGEYVSVYSQKDIEDAELSIQSRQLVESNEEEQVILENIYIERGLSADLATEVVDQLMAKNALETFARDELGFTHELKARPLQAALSSAGSFAIGAAMPLMVTLVTPYDYLLFTISTSTLLFLAILGSTAAYVARAPIIPGLTRVMIWGILAMSVTTGIGMLFKVVV